jgi:hypothetical protein
MKRPIFCSTVEGICMPNQSGDTFVSHCVSFSHDSYKFASKPPGRVLERFQSPPILHTLYHYAFRSTTRRASLFKQEPNLFQSNIAGLPDNIEMPIELVAYATLSVRVIWSLLYMLIMLYL